MRYLLTVVGTKSCSSLHPGCHGTGAEVPETKARRAGFRICNEQVIREGESPHGKDDSKRARCRVWPGLWCYSDITAAFGAGNRTCSDVDRKMDDGKELPFLVVKRVLSLHA